MQIYGTAGVASDLADRSSLVGWYCLMPLASGGEECRLRGACRRGKVCPTGIIEHGFYRQERVKESCRHVCAHR